MSTSLFSLIFAGVVGSGVFVGTLQQNVLKTEKPYIDKLFHEIERDIREFSNRNPLTATVANKIKQGPDSSSLEVRSKRKRNAVTSEKEEKESKNTLGVWTDIWVGLLSDYIFDLWQNNMTSSTTINEKSRNFSDEEREKAVQYADKENKEEKKRFEEKLNGEDSKIEEIYKKMKDFILEIEFPETYEYNTKDSDDGPYENYIKKILEE